MRFVFDTSVLIDYLHDEEIAVNALVAATNRGEVFVSLISMMELYLPQNRSNAEIAREVEAVRELCERLGIKIIPASPAAQDIALTILQNHHSELGRNALPDSLILGIGMDKTLLWSQGIKSGKRLASEGCVLPRRLFN